MENFSIILFILVYFLYALRIILLSLKKSDYRHLFLSCYLVTNTISLGKVLYSPFGEHVSGAFGEAFFLSSAQILSACLLVSTKKSFSRIVLPKEKSFLFLIALFIISLINPSNIELKGTYIAIYNLLSIIIFAYIVFKNLSYDQIIKGIWDGLCIVSIVEFVICILYPVLNITIIPQIFGATDVVSELRSRGTGTFMHPNMMGAFMTYVSSFFISCIICNYQKKRSIIILLFALSALVLSLSRSAIIAVSFSFSLIWLLYKYPYLKFFSVRTFLKVILPSILVVVLIILFTPLKKYFISIDADSMLDYRKGHNLYYLYMFLGHPFLGVGLNTGVSYFNEFYQGLEGLFEYASGSDIFEFASKNPVHNIFISVLVDTGILGFMFFIYFMIRTILMSKKRLIFELDNENSNIRILPLTSIACLVAVSIHGLSDYTPLNVQNMSLWLFICLVANYTNTEVLYSNKMK